MDVDKDGFIFFEEYVEFVDKLTSKEIRPKAQISFQMLDYDNKGYIVEEDIKVMMQSLFELWNMLTGSKVIVLPEYVTKVFKYLDVNGDKEINLEEYE